MNKDFLSKISHDEDGQFKGQYPFSFFAGADRGLRSDLNNPDNPKRSECFNYIMYGWDSFRKELTPYLKDAKSFIDVGCGAGDKVHLAKKINPNLWACGIELSKPMTVWADAMGVENVWHGDAFKLDYSNWDVIYAYWPIPDHEKMALLMYHIITTMRSGANLIIVGWAPRTGHNPMTNVDNHWLYIKP